VRPSNIGFGFDGELKLYDFGLAKKLKAKDQVGLDQFKATQLTGCCRYWSPEVYYGESYGFSADSYSFALVLWQMISLRIPFNSLEAEQHTNVVYEQNMRPYVSSSCPRQVKLLMRACWDKKATYRLSFPTICKILKRYLDSKRS